MFQWNENKGLRNALINIIRKHYDFESPINYKPIVCDFFNLFPHLKKELTKKSVEMQIYHLVTKKGDEVRVQKDITDTILDAVVTLSEVKDLDMEGFFNGLAVLAKGFKEDIEKQKEREEKIGSLQQEVDRLNEENSQLRELFTTINQLVNDYMSYEPIEKLNKSKSFAYELKYIVDKFMNVLDVVQEDA